MDSTVFIRTVSYLPEFHVFLCLICCIGVRRSQITSHFRLQHHFTSVRLKGLDSFCQTLLPNSNGQSIETVPSYVEDAIVGLPVFSDGLLCQIDRTNCQYICRSTESMRKHCQRAHQWQKKSTSGRPSTSLRTILPSLPYISVRCQRLFTSGPNSHFFEVRTTRQTAETPTAEVWQQMEAAVQQVQENAKNRIQNDTQDTSPWLRRTRWAEILSDLTRTQLLGYIQEPDLQVDSDETRLWNAVRELIQHCQETVMKSGHFVRTQMVQTEHESKPMQPLQAYFHHPDLLRSCRHWQQIFLFFVRAHPDTSVPLPYELTPIQQRSLERLQNCLRTERTEGASDDTEQRSPLSALQQACLDFCFSLLNHRLRTDEYESGLVVALAVLGLTPDGFRGPLDYPSMLSGIIKTARFMMTQLAVRPSEYTQDFFYDLGTDTRPDHDTISRTTQIMQTFMVRGTQSPVQWMLDLRSYGMKIAQNTTVEGQMDWVGDQVVYQDIQFTMSEFRAFVHGLLYETERLLLQELLFTRTISESIPHIDLAHIKDNVVDRRPGWNFLQDLRNPSLIDGAAWMRDRISRYPSLRTKLLPDQVDPVHPPSSVQTYLTHVRTFLTKLLLLTHITGGQPARIPELLTVRHRNSSHDEPRNIFLEDGLVAFVTRYHKGYAISGEQKIIHRYLPYEVSLIVVRYLWLVLPFVERLESFYCSSYERSNFLWPAPPRESVIGTWDSNHVRRALQNESRIGLGQTLNIQSYRHLVIGISRRFLSSGHHFTEEDRTEEDAGRTEEEKEQDVLDLQAAHSSSVAGAIYARGINERAGEIWSERQRFRRISVQWHQFLQFSLVRTTSTESHKRLASSDLGAVDTHHQRVSILRTMSLDDQLHQLLGSASEFRTIQRPALQAIIHGDSPILTILPTGGGKSLLFLLPASHMMSGTTIVIVPLISLRTDLVRRCREHLISCQVWNARQPADGAKIVLVTPEGAVTPAFANFINRLRTIHQLDRIVLDECHLVLEHGSFRAAFDHLHQLSRTEVPLLFLTATLPPSRETDFWQRLTLSRVPHHIFRTTTVRPNIQYAVASLPTMDAVVGRTKGIMASILVGRIILYCLDVRTVEEVAEALQIPQYHSRYAHKATALQSFTSGSDRTIVATSALGLGIDLPDVRAVIHLGVPRTLLDYAQESGRAGRDGQPSQAMIIESPIFGRGRYAESDPIDEYLTARCRRTVLNRYLDGSADPGSCPTSMSICDVCNLRPSSQPIAEPPASMIPKDIVRSRAGPFIRQEAQQEMMKQGISVERGIQLLEGFRDQCMLCVIVRSERHSVSDCRASDRAAYSEGVEMLRRTIRYERFSGCFQCGLPQTLCDGWASSSRGSHKKTQEGCQFPTSLSEAGGIFLTNPQDFPIVRSDLRAPRWQIEPTEGTDLVVERKKIVQQLGKKIRWMNLETNNLFQQVMNVYSII